MDTSGFSQIGRYGTLSLMKRNEPNTAVTAFGIDFEELTFGRDPACSVRLYYQDVDLVHCKIIFQERKAFLVVLGQNGLLVDGCQVLPSTSPNSADIPMTIPLSNNSEIEIHKKRFKFTYPPKELRSALFATPPRPKNRSLRLSMIESAQVFTPRPSKNPQENLRILQSPLKNTFKSPKKPSFLSRTPVNAREEQEEESIVLVNGNQPRVVEEERDLVILEDVNLSSTPGIMVEQPQVPQTPPRKRSLSRNTLHRAVLIRSAQRAVMRAEMEKEEEEEELEVLGAVSSDDIDNISDKGDDEGQDENVEDEDNEPEERKSMWRKSLEKIWPFGSSDGTPEENATNDDNEMDEVPPPDESSEEEEDELVPIRDEDDEGSADEEINDEPTPLPAMHSRTPSRRVMGSFMTPQAKPPSRTSIFSRQNSSATGRFSLGGEARRVPIEQPWRIKDIVVPLKSEPKIEDENLLTNAKHMIPEETANQTFSSPSRPLGRQKLSEEERQAISERRRSALKEPDNFFAGGIPGMTPLKSLGRSLSPTKMSTWDQTNQARFSTPSREAVKSNNQNDPDEDLDTRSLLDRMKETVEGMKRRKSLAPVSLNPPEISTTDKTDERAPVGSLQDHDHSQIAVDENSSTGVVAAENDSSEAEAVFSLLRPGAKDQMFTKTMLDLPSSLETSQRPTEIVQMDSYKEPSHTIRQEVTSVDNAFDKRKQSSSRERTIATESKTFNQRNPSRGSSKGTPRARTPLPEPEVKSAVEDIQETQESADPSGSKPTVRRGRKPISQVDEVPATKRTNIRTNTDKEVPPTGHSRRAPKATAESEAPAVEIVKRGRKPAPVKEDHTEQLPTKRGRKPAITPTEEVKVVEETTRSSRATTKPAALRKGRGTKAQPVELDQEDDDDPLDSIDGLVKEEPIPKVKGRRNATQKEVKVEADKDGDTSVPAVTRGARSKAATKPITATTTKTPATKTRNTNKTPATAPAATHREEVNKENTPGSGSGSGKNSPSVDTEGAVPVKVRVSRTRTAKASSTAKGKVKEEEVEEPVRGRVMRSRARTRTD